MSTIDLPNTIVKIKQEKLDPEVERKLNPTTLLPDSTNSADEEAQAEEEEKKNVEPFKSSNEILAELFMVFNAKPPVELLSNNKLSKKSKKEKKSKHKKGKKRKRKVAENSEISNNDSSEEGSKHKRKKHKRKHKKKSKEKSEDDEKPNVNERTVIMAADSSSSSKLKHSIKKEPIEELQVKVEKLSSKCENRSRVEERLRNCSRVDDGSDISLSDEETFLRERNRFKDSNTPEVPLKRSNDRYRNDFYRSSNSYYSSERQERSYHRHHHHHRSRSGTRTRSRSNTRSRSPPRDLGIDKKRLLEIARKNAISMFKSGSLPGCVGMSEEVKDKVLMKMRYGGKTVQDLTNFCRKLTKGENYDDLSEFSTDEESDVDKQGNAKAFHHPFVLKDREPIVMHIKNATSIIPKTADQKKAITMQFPVSSGQQHRLTEGWVPVPAKESEVSAPPPVVSKPVIIKNVGVPKNVFQKQLPVEEQQPAFKPVNGVAPSSETATPEAVPPPLSVPTSALCSSILPSPIIIAPVVDSVPTPTIFTPMSPSMDVSTIISQRLSAMRRLQENPMDCEAIKMMYTSQKEMTSWASSKHMPGQFTGSTGANILTARELTSGSQAWARRDQLTSTVPVSGGMGMHLLKKMGWKPGEGLGREKTGSLQPLLLDVKLDKRGLVADEEVNGNRPPRPGPAPKRKKNPVAGQMVAKQALDNKHPVCLLNELATKRKWTPPMFELVTDEGPSHSKFFVFSVNVNGQIFNPGCGGNTKKEAKMLTAKHCLQQMGVLS